MSLKLQRKLAPMMGKATGANRKLKVNFLVRVCTVHVRRPQHLSGVLLAVTMRGPVGAAADLCGMMLKVLPESTRYLLELAASTM